MRLNRCVENCSIISLNMSLNVFVIKFKNYINFKLHLKCGLKKKSNYADVFEEVGEYAIC